MSKFDLVTKLLILFATGVGFGLNASSYILSHRFNREQKLAVVAVILGAILMATDIYLYKVS